VTPVALVTGADGGLGRALTDALEAAGWGVATSDMPRSRSEFPADLRQPEAPSALVSAVIAACGRLDMLVNNAATMYYGPLDLADLDRWWDTIDVNLGAPFRLARATASELRRTRGQIVNIASSHGVMAEPGFSAYCSSKAGLIGLTKALALELAPAVRVNAIAPGDMDTPQQEVDAAAAGLTREELYADYARTIPIGRIIEPAEVARLLVYLAGETGFTGSCLHINGGSLLV
jgi:NAD(P)-dependent dehydrogenase (short-subunit alcohol dehydrogenase family)